MNFNLFSVRCAFYLPIVDDPVLFNGSIGWSLIDVICNPINSGSSAHDAICSPVVVDGGPYV